jgi:hypothetical protein
MKSRILVSMLVIALSAALVGGATMSIFKAQGETDEQTYAAGTVEITAGEQTFHEIDTLENMAPGDTIYGSFDVANTGTLPLWFTVTAETSEVDGFYNLFDGNFPAVVTIDEYNNIIEPDDEETTISFSVRLPIGAGNEYQGAKGNLKFKIYAEQLAHNPPTQ